TAATTSAWGATVRYRAQPRLHRGQLRSGHVDQAGRGHSAPGEQLRLLGQRDRGHVMATEHQVPAASPSVRSTSRASAGHFVDKCQLLVEDGSEVGYVS